MTGIGNAGVQSASSRGWGRILCGGHHQPAPENFVLHQQLTVYKRSVTRPKRWRRSRLEEIVTGGELVFPVRRLPPNGLEAWATVLEHGYEGMVGKDEASPYRGGITRSWLKVKVPGWTDPEDRWRRARLN